MCVEGGGGQLATLSIRRRADKMWSPAVHPQGSAPPRTRLPSRLHLPKISQSSKTVPPVGEHKFKHASLWGYTSYSHSHSVSEKRKQTKQVNLLSWSPRVYISFSLRSNAHVADPKATPFTSHSVTHVSCVIASLLLTRLTKYEINKLLNTF